VVSIVGFDLIKAQVGDVVVKVTHNGFIFRAKAWVKIWDKPNG
jgi:hypothetical protein